MPSASFRQSYSAKSLFLVFFSAIFLFFISFIIEVSKGEAAIVPIPDVCSDNLLQTQNDVTCYSDGGMIPTCGVHAECCTPLIGCIPEIAACTISMPTTNTWFDTIESLGFNYVANCTDSIAPSFITCLRDIVGKCPSGYSALAYDGYNCDIYKQKDVDNIFHPSTVGGHSGKWSANQQKCVTCSGAYEDKRCADTGSFSLDASGNCNGAGDGNLESACGADPACDDQAVGFACAAGSQCQASGACVPVAVNALSLNITPASNPVTTGGTTIVTFHVTKASDGTAISGATVTVTSASCNSPPSPAGDTTSTFTAPGVAAVCTINAKAALATYTDGMATTSINVTSCSLPNFAEFQDYRYAKNQSILLDGLSPDAFNNFYLCIYNDAGSIQRSDPFVTGFPQTISFIASTLGTWKGLAVAGPVGCPNPFDATQGCPASTEVVECETNTDCTATATCDLSTYTCSGGGAPSITACTAGCGAYCSVTRMGDSVPGGCSNLVFQDICNPLIANDCMTCSVTLSDGSVCDCSTYIICSGGGGCDNDGTCDGPGEDGTNCAADCCKAGGGCPTGCTIANDPDCAAACVPTGPEAGNCSDTIDNDCANGADCADPACAVDPVCIAAVPVCDPNAWKYCNPLRGTVDNLVQAGETLLGYILGLIGSIALLVIIIAGVIYMTSAGSEEKISTAKRILTGAVIGIIIALLAYSLLQVIISIL